MYIQECLYLIREFATLCNISHDGYPMSPRGAAKSNGVLIRYRPNDCTDSGLGGVLWGKERGGMREGEVEEGRSGKREGDQKEEGE